MDQHIDVEGDCRPWNDGASVKPLPFAMMTISMFFRQNDWNWWGLNIGLCWDPIKESFGDTDFQSGSFYFGKILDGPTYPAFSCYGIPYRFLGSTGGCESQHNKNWTRESPWAQWPQTMKWFQVPLWNSNLGTWNLSKLEETNTLR